MDLKKGKDIFYKFKGNKMHIVREIGNEYEKCCVPVQVEYQWREDIKKILHSKIQASSGSELISDIDSYINLLEKKQQINFLVDVLQKRQLDTFSRLILCETLKNLSYKKPLIEDIIVNNKSKMLKNDIIIDQSFLFLKYMKDYDFSKMNIIARINKL